MREEIHAAELIRVGKNKNYKKIRKADRIAILREYSQQMPVIFSSSKIINICIDKNKKEYLNGKTDFNALAWNRLIQRFENYLNKQSSSGIIISDYANEHIVGLLRKMRVFNYIPRQTGNRPVKRIIEDVSFRDSRSSYFVQSVDVAAHCLYRKEYLKGSLKKFQVDQFFNNLEPILLKEASAADPLGIVRK